MEGGPPSSCLQRGAPCHGIIGIMVNPPLHIVQLMPLHPKTPPSLALFRSRLVLPFWYLLTQVVLEKLPLNGCSVVVVAVVVVSLYF